MDKNRESRKCLGCRRVSLGAMLEDDGSPAKLCIPAPLSKRGVSTQQYRMPKTPL